MAQRTSDCRPPVAGYVLLEVMLALMVFAISAVGMTVAISESIDALNALDRDEAIRKGLDAILAEAKLRPKPNEMALAVRDEKLEVEYRTEAVPLRLTTEKGEPIGGLYELKAIATFKTNGEPEEMNTFVYVRR